MEKSVIIVNNRPCNVQKSKKYPNAYSKAELVEYAMKEFGMKKSELVRMKKEKICDILDKGKEKVKKKKTPPTASKKPFPVPTTCPKETISKERNCIKRSKLSLRDYQINVVEHMKRNRGLIFAAEVGSGKTLTAVTSSQCFLDENPNGRILIVTPKTLIENFKISMVKYGANPHDSRYHFYTYQKFANLFGKGSERCKDSDMLIIDEAHNIRTALSFKKPNTRASVTVRCAKSVGKVLLLTGTPVFNSTRDVLNLVAMIKGEHPIGEKRFQKMSNTIFTEYFKCMFSFYNITKDENYPTFSYSDIFIIMDSTYSKNYRNVEKRIEKSDVQAVRDLVSGKNPWRFLTGMRQAANSLEPCLKCEWVVNKIKDGNKTIVYSAFKSKGINLVKTELDKEDISYVEITGDSGNSEDRQNIVKIFNSEDPSSPKVLFITQAGSEGIDMKGTRNIILMEASWNEAREEQVIGRSIRCGSHLHLPKNERHVNIYRLYLQKSGKGHKFKSSDMILKKMKEDKQKEINIFLDKLRAISIENLVCEPIEELISEISEDVSVIQQGGDVPFTFEDEHPTINLDYSTKIYNSRESKDMMYFLENIGYINNYYFESNIIKTLKITENVNVDWNRYTQDFKNIIGDIIEIVNVPKTFFNSVLVMELENSKDIENNIITTRIEKEGYMIILLFGQTRTIRFESSEFDFEVDMIDGSSLVVSGETFKKWNTKILPSDTNKKSYILRYMKVLS